MGVFLMESFEDGERSEPCRAEWRGEVAPKVPSSESSGLPP